jgi:protein O-GlcNAc transferase
MSPDVSTEVKTVLHVGCGQPNPLNLHPHFRNDEWKEIRLDIDPGVSPDIVGDITHMNLVADASVDAVWSSHNIEHLWWHEVHLAFQEFYRVLKVGGFVYVATPNLQEVAKHVAEGNLEEPLYVSPSGPVSAIDILYGFRPSLRQGHHYMAHKTGFTAKTLGQRMVEAGFVEVNIKCETLNLWGLGHKR